LVETPLGNIENSLVVYYHDSTVEDSKPLELHLAAPFDQQVVNVDSLVVKGQIFNAFSDAIVTINGIETSLYGSAESGLLFNHVLDLSASLEGAYQVTALVSANGQDIIEKILSLNIDRQAPVITIDNTLQSQPGINEIIENPYKLSGTVSDAHLASVSINGQSLVLQPAAGQNTYRFDTNINLIAGQQNILSIIATDAAGKESIEEYTLLSNPQAVIEVVQPVTNTEFVVYGGSQSIEFISRITGLAESATLTVIAGSNSQNFPISETIASGQIIVSLADSVESLRFEVRNTLNELLASTDVAVKFIDGDNIPLTLEKTLPSRNDINKEPHLPIQFHFNKQVSLTDLTIDVKETYHGKTYTTDYISGAQLESKYRGEIIEIHKDQSPVTGHLSLLPGEHIVEFYPAADLSYGAKIFVSVKYLNEELTRFIYQVRDNPTFFSSNVKNQLNQVIPDITVTIPELGLSLQTDENGTFMFGAGLPAEQNIKTGLYRVVVNPNRKNPKYGVNQMMVNIEQGKINKAPVFTIPELSSQVSFKYLSSGNTNNVLAGGDLIIDTQQAQLSFEDRSSSGNVHVQIIDSSSGVYRVDKVNLTPLWMFNLQPGNISVRGEISLQIKMPQLYGSYDYLPVNGTRVLLMGLSESTLNIEPIGVGIIQNKSVVSEGVVQAERLDYIGYTFIEQALQPVLQEYVDGTVSLSQLTHRLTAQ